MISRLIHHANRHSVGYVALVCSMLALGGASYAAIKIPNGSVGEKQIKNHVIDPVKWDTTYVTDFIRRWARVNADGSLGTASSFAQSAAVGGPGSYDVTWGDAFSGKCMALATIQSGVTQAGTPTTTTTPAPTTTTTPSTTTTTASTTTTSSTTTTTGTTTTTPTPTPIPGAGFADTNIITQNKNATVVNVTTFNNLGQPAPEPFYLAITCPPGAGGGTTYPYTLP
jgi:hypothetical protein